jgi:hypothetical protein
MERAGVIRKVLRALFALEVLIIVAVQFFATAYFLWGLGQWVWEVFRRV